jgi:hypothetical protein
MNPAISRSRISRRNPNEALELAARRRKETELAALDAADRTNALIDAMKRESGPLPKTGPRTGSHPMATRDPRPDPRGPQEPATTIPDGGTVAMVDRQTILTAHLLLMVIAVIVGFILGRAL